MSGLDDMAEKCVTIVRFIAVDINNYLSFLITCPILGKNKV